jgi:hypothetical protein
VQTFCVIEKKHVTQDHIVVFFRSSGENYGSVHPACNPYFSACFFSQNSVFLSQQISQQCFSASLSALLNGAYHIHGTPQEITIAKFATQITGQLLSQT